VIPYDMQAPVAVRCLWTNCYTLPLPLPLPLPIERTFSKGGLTMRPLRSKTSDNCVSALILQCNGVGRV